MKNSKSIILRRQQALLGALKAKKTVDVEEMARELSVSPTTIRRDLNNFAKRHIVARFHGGARLIKETLLLDEDAPSIVSAPLTDGGQKHAIAKYDCQNIGNVDDAG